MRERGVLDVAAALHESKKADDLWANVRGNLIFALILACLPNLRDEVVRKLMSLYVSASV